MYVSVFQGGFDLTIRIADLPDSTMIARPLMPAPRWVVAAPDLVSRIGEPHTPGDIRPEHWLGYGNLGASAGFALERTGERVRVHPRGVMSTDNGELLLQMAEAGMGMVLLPEFIVGESVAAGRLVRLLPDWEAAPLTVHAVHLSERRVPMKTRAFIDFLRGSLSPQT